MKRVIVTGATGVIGIALVNYLLEKNIDVVAIVNPESRRVNRLPTNDKLLIVRHSTHKLKTLTREVVETGSSEMKESSFDAFFHLAWRGTIGPDRDNIDLQLSNVQDTLEAVRFASRCGCKTFIGAGSQAEYGQVSEKISSNTPVNPNMGYGVAKLCAGHMSRILCQQLEMRHIWVRILSIYGPYDSESTMIISSIRKMLQGECPRFSKGEQMWDYLYSEDAARAIYLVAEKGKNGAVYPIGSGETREISQYIEIMRKSVGDYAKIEIGALPYRENQTMYLCADIKALTKDTGFLPTITFEDGIHRTIEWCKQSEGDVENSQVKVENEIE